MSKKSPTPERFTATGIEAKIELLAIEMERLSFIDQSFGLSFDIHKKEKNKEKIFPACYQTGRKDPISMLPNDNLNCFSFWTKEDPGKMLYNDDEGTKIRAGYINYTVNCIIYMNVLKIANEFITGKSQLREALRDFFDTQLRTIPLVLITTEIYDDSIKDIYDGYSLEGLTTALLYPPHAAFRFSFDLSFLSNCSTVNPYRL
jgi:hypothetical protein